MPKRIKGPKKSTNKNFEILKKQRKKGQKFSEIGEKIIRQTNVNKNQNLQQKVKSEEIMSANTFFGYTAHSQAAPAPGFNTGVAPPPPGAAYPAAASGAVTPTVVITAQPQVASGAVAANQFVAQSQPQAPPPPSGTPYRPAVIAYSAYQHPQNINAATYVMAPPTAASTPVVVTSVYPTAMQHQINATYVMAPPTAASTPVVTSVYPTMTYHPYPPPATPTVAAAAAAAAAAQVQVYEAANTNYCQAPVSSGVQVSYTIGGAHYTARPTYSAGSNQMVSRPTIPTFSYGQQKAAYSYGGPSHTVAAANLKSNLYALPPSSVAPNTATTPVSHPAWTHHNNTIVKMQHGGQHLGGQMMTQIRQPKPPRPPPKPQQLHYCDVCKISCAGPQTYQV